MEGDVIVNDVVEIVPAAAEVAITETPEVPSEGTVAVDTSALAMKVESLEKALKDTQSWGHKNAEELARIKRENEEVVRQANRPELLQTVEGLEEAIRYATNTDKDPVKSWTATISEAIPDISKYLDNPEFHRVAEQRMQEIQGAYTNPIIAIRELSNLKTQYIQHMSATTAKEAAKKEFEDKAKKLSALSVPGGSGSAAPVGNGPDWANMPADEFHKHRSKVLGF